MVSPSESTSVMTAEKMAASGQPLILPSASEIYEHLLAVYGKPQWWSSDPFTVIFQSVLVQQTSWKNVLSVTERIGDKLSSEYILSLSSEALEVLIKPCGFQKSKARTIKSLAAWFVSAEYSSLSDAELRNELLAIKGVGEETADAILVYAFYRPSFIIDAYTRRFMKRIGYDFPSDKALRRFFEDCLPRDAYLYGYFHWLILEHSIQRCRKKPDCSSCGLVRLCRYSDISSTPVYEVTC